MEKIARNETQTNIDEITATIKHRVKIVDDEIETIRSSVKSVKSGLTSEIQQVNVSLVI